MRGETNTWSRLISSKNFNPLSSCEERRKRSRQESGRGISIHSPHARRDEANSKQNGSESISIHSPHARRDFRRCKQVSAWESISIHSPHARRDFRRCKQVSAWESISIHSPHARRDFISTRKSVNPTISIHSPHARRDSESRSDTDLRKYFNPLSSCEERRP